MIPTPYPCSKALWQRRRKRYTRFLPYENEALAKNKQALSLTHCIALHVASRIAAIGHMRYLFLRRLEMIRHIRYLRPLPPISQIADQTRPPFSHLRWDPKQYAGRPKYYLIPSKKAKKQKPSVDYAGQIDTRAYTLTQGSHLMIRPTTGGHSCVGYRSGLAMASRGK